MVNNGYVSRIPQDLKGTIEEIQGGGSGSGLVLEKILFYIATFGPASIPANTIHNFDTATSVTFYDPQTHGGYTLTPEEGAKTLFLPATGFQAGVAYCLGSGMPFYNPVNSEIGCSATFYNSSAIDLDDVTLRCMGVVFIIS